MSESGSLVEDLMGIKGEARSIAYDAERDRFNMPHCADTSVRKDLNANRIIVGGKNIAIATQYPLPHQIEPQLQMMLDNYTPVLIILASTTDIQNNLLPEYFSGSRTYGDIQTQSKFVDYIDLSNTIEAKVYTLSITKHEVSTDIPVLHVYNWPDHRTVSPETTTSLVDLIESTVGKRRAYFEQENHPALGDNEKMLPVIHCKAGVGRTGQTLAAIVMSQYPEIPLDTITKDLRASRNDRMIQTPYQMKTLVTLASRQGDKEKSAVPSKKSAKKGWRAYFSKLT